MQRPRPLQWIEEAEAQQVGVIALSERMPRPAWCGTTRRAARRWFALLRRRCVADSAAEWAPLPALQLQPAPVGREPPRRPHRR